MLEINKFLEKCETCKYLITDNYKRIDKNDLFWIEWNSNYFSSSNKNIINNSNLDTFNINECEHCDETCKKC